MIPQNVRTVTEYFRHLRATHPGREGVKRLRELAALHGKVRATMAPTDSELKIRSANERIDWPKASDDVLSAIRRRDMSPEMYEKTLGNRERR